MGVLPALCGGELEMFQCNSVLQDGCAAVTHSSSAPAVGAKRVRRLCTHICFDKLEAPDIFQVAVETRFVLPTPDLQESADCLCCQVQQHGTDAQDDTTVSGKLPGITGES